MIEKISIKYYLLSVIVPIACIFFVFGYALKYVDDEITFKEYELIGLKKAKEIQDTVIYLQRLRGITRMNNFSNKYDVIKKEYIHKAKQNINKLEKNLNTNERNHFSSLSITGFVTSIRNIFKNQDKYSKDKIFESYSTINEKSFLLQKEIALHSKLKLDNDKYTNMLIETVVYQLPELIEYMGQLRALLTSKGEGIISKREFVDLSNRISVIRDLVNALDFNMKHVLELEMNEKKSLNSKYSNAINSKNKLINYVYSNFETNKPLDNSENIYEFFTLNINSMIELYSFNVQLVQNSLEQRLNREIELKQYLIIFGFLCILFIVYNFLNYYRKNNDLILTIKRTNKDLKTFKIVMDEVGAYVFTKDLNGCYTFANNLVLGLFNKPLNDVLGEDDSHFFDLELSHELRENDIRVLKHGEVIEKEEKNIIKDTGEIRVYWSVKKPIYDSSGNIIGMCGISTDITKRKTLENKVIEQKYLLDTILDNVDAYIYMKDSNRHFCYVNAKVAKLFNKPIEDIIGKKDTEVLPKEMADIFWETDKKVFLTNKETSTEESITDPKGKMKHYWSVKLPYTLKEEKMLIGFSSDITEVYLLKEELKKLAITDALTNLYNKRHFIDIATSEFRRSIRHRIDMSIIILDIDFFKKINDTYGHAAGDKILQNAAQNCKSLIRTEDTLFRIGGEEFAILLPHTQISKAVDLAERIRINQENKILTGDWKGDIKITFSLGVSHRKSTDHSYEDILLRADKALYKAKDSGRNKVISYE